MVSPESPSRRPMWRAIHGLLFGLAIPGMPSLAAWAEEPKRPGSAIVLDTQGVWRMHMTLKAPVLRGDDGVKPTPLAQRWLREDTPAPPADWAGPDFDDSGWLRGPSTVAPNTALLARLCLRGKFTVTEPARVKGLTLAAAYHGGVIVYLNGQEVGRFHVPASGRGDTVVAEPYPEEAFVTEDGKYLAPAGAYLDGRPSGPPTPESERRMGLRVRTLASLVIRPESLRKGANVLGIEVIRAPYDRVFDTVKMKRVNSFPHEFTWSTCRLLRVQLTAAGSEGLVPNAARPEGLQVWNADMLAGDTDLDFGDQAEALRPIRLVGPRNGTFSGKVLVGSTRPIQGLSATAGELRGPAGSIPASAVRIRYGIPWGEEYDRDATYHPQGSPYPVRPTLMACLSPTPLKEYPVSRKEARGLPGSPRPVPGAVAPVWVTAKIPRDARPGVYTGEVSIAVQGERATRVPVQLKVLDWTLPDPQDYRSWVELIQSPDTLALEYGVELWSDRHWELIGRSMRFLNEAGSRVVYIPLLAHTNLGNEQSMVRWIDKGGGEFDHDFSVMERYLDTAEKHMGKPKMVVFNVWDVYLIPKQGGRTSGGTGGHRRFVDATKAGGAPGPLVTAVDPTTRKLENAYLPPYSDPTSKGAWGALFAELRKRMARRGLENAMTIGMLTDAFPTRDEVAFLKEVTADLPWVSHGHGGFGPNQLLHSIARVAYQASVWRTGFSDGVETHGATLPERVYGWRNPQLNVVFERNTDLDTYPTTRWRLFMESNITGNQRGIGRLGADFWAALRDAEGRRRGAVWTRHPESLWMNLNISTSVLCPGPDGPCATNRFEALREGIQECEARVFIERALTDEALEARLGADLTRRCQDALDARWVLMWRSLSSLQLCGPGWANACGWRWTPGVSGHIFFLGSGWQERGERLYSLAGEVERATRGIRGSSGEP